MSAINEEYARDILSHLVALMTGRPKGYEKYAKLFGTGRAPHHPGRDTVAVRDLLFSSMRKEVFEIFTSPQIRPSQDIIRLKSGDITKAQRGIYLHIIEGIDGQWRFWIGQSENLSFRIRGQHQNFRHRRDNPSLQHYALHKSRWDYFVVLAVLPPGPTAAGFSQLEQELLLNMLHMWCALLFGTLRRETMADWHVYGDIARPCQWIGMNFACPLDRRERGNFIDLKEALRESEDPLARDYAVNELHAKRKLTREPTPSGPLCFGAIAALLMVAFMASASQPLRRS